VRGPSYRCGCGWGFGTAIDSEAGGCQRLRPRRAPRGSVDLKLVQLNVLSVEHIELSELVILAELAMLGEGGGRWDSIKDARSGSS
jgi:hypothetical protein